MIDIFVPALMRAWVVTVVAVAALLVFFAVEPEWNSAVYWHGLPRAFALIGDEGPAPFRDEIVSRPLQWRGPLAGFQPRWWRRWVR